jgi:hypothetical protein
MTRKITTIIRQAKKQAILILQVITIIREIILLKLTAIVNLRLMKKPVVDVDQIAMSLLKVLPFLIFQLKVKHH